MMYKIYEYFFLVYLIYTSHTYCYTYIYTYKKKLKSKFGIHKT